MSASEIKTVVGAIEFIQAAVDKADDGDWSGFSDISEVEVIAIGLLVSKNFTRTGALRLYERAVAIQSLNNTVDMIGSPGYDEYDLAIANRKQLLSEIKDMLPAIKLENGIYQKQMVDNHRLNDDIKKTLKQIAHAKYRASIYPKYGRYSILKDLLSSLWSYYGLHMVYDISNDEEDDVLEYSASRIFYTAWCVRYLIDECGELAHPSVATTEAHIQHLSEISYYLGMGYYQKMCHHLTYVTGYFSGLLPDTELSTGAERFISELVANKS